MKRLARTAAVLAFVALSGGASASAPCPERLGVAWGDTLTSIAQACGVTVTSLRRANPGLSAQTLQAGAFINVPRPALPSPVIVIGRPQVQVAPPLTPRTPGIASPTVILPPPETPIPPQHILRGFGGEPGQLPLPPGHYTTIP